MQALPEWIFGESDNGERQFLLHTTAPRFIGEIFDEELSGKKLNDRAILDEVSVSLRNGQTLANITWLDAHSDLSVDLVRRAADALEAYDRVLDSAEED